MRMTMSPCAHMVKSPHGTTPKEHFDIGEALGLMDFDAAAQLSGARFTVLKGGLARMERALGQFMLDMHTTEHGYTEVMPPLLVNAAPLYGTGQLPKFEDDQFKTENGHYLIPTAEVPLTNLARDAIHSEDRLPQRYTALTPCFRLEAGSAGRDTRGMLRQHQFNKCEMVTITHAEQGESELERMTACAEKILQNSVCITALLCFAQAIWALVPVRPMTLRFGSLDRIHIARFHLAHIVGIFKRGG